MKRIAILLGFFNFGLLVSGGCPEDEFHKIRNRKKNVEERTKAQSVEYPDKNQMTIFATLSNWGSWVQNTLCAPGMPKQANDD